MLLVNNLQRVFVFKQKDQEIRLSDPGEQLSPEEVLNFYSPQYPVLTTAKVVGPKIENDEVCYKFVPMIGTKG